MDSVHKEPNGMTSTTEPPYATEDFRRPGRPATVARARPIQAVLTAEGS